MSWQVNDQRIAKVRTIILFDPGSKANMDAACDSRLMPTINLLLANWLRSNALNRLIVLTGCDSEDHSLSARLCLGKSTFNGLWTYYFASIWNQPFASRALVCDYNKLGHKQVLAYFSWIVKNPLDSCPVSDKAPKPITWNP